MSSCLEFTTATNYNNNRVNRGNQFYMSSCLEFTTATNYNCNYKCREFIRVCLPLLNRQRPKLQRRWWTTSTKSTRRPRRCAALRRENSFLAAPGKHPFICWKGSTIYIWVYVYKFLFFYLFTYIFIYIYM